MKARHNDIIVDTTEPFKNCGLGRKKYALILTDILNTYSENFVLALNSEWGTGKTTFIKMWQQHLENEKFKTLYFNAWENDFKSDPIIPLLSELRNITNNSDDIYKKLLKSGATLAKNIVPTIINLLAKKHLGSESLSEIITKTSEGALEIFESEINQFVEKKESLEKFKKELTEYISKKETEFPVIFFIDELDRCRPNYAVEVLEQLKHFFSVQGIIFVLSIDKVQLGNAVRGFYGSELIDSNEYLRRFIDLEYKIPAPPSIDYCKYLYVYFDFNSFFRSPAREKDYTFKNDYNYFIELTALLFEKESFSLRYLEKLFSHTRLVLKQFKSNDFVFPTLLFFLIYIKDKDPVLYNNLCHRKISVQEAITDIERNFFTPQSFDGVEVLPYTISLFIHLYFNYLKEEENNLEIIITSDVDRDGYLNIKSKFSSAVLHDHIISFKRKPFEYTKIDTYLNKINLYENLIN